jgi:hypothetical protein
MCPPTEEEQHIPWNICDAMTDGTPNLSPTDERLVPNHPRGRGRLIGGDLDVGEEGSQQMIVTLQSLHHGSVGYQHARARVGLTKKAKFLQMQPRTQARTRKNTTKLQTNNYTQKLGSYKP